MESGLAGSDSMTNRRLAGLAILVVWLIPARRLDRGPVLCPFRRITGLPCPTCGLTRSWNAALHGQLRESVAFHPLGLLTLIGAAAIAAGIDEREPVLTRRLRSRAVVGSIAAAWVAVWLIRVLAARR
jgi:hypothetical protein